MTRVVASAPGKLMLAGEYAVAEGLAPALAVAVARRVTVTVDDAPDWRVTSPALDLHEAPLGAVPVVEAAVARAGAGSEGGHVRVDSDLGSGPDKPGFGASAAVAVATLGALYERAGRPAPTLADVVETHREAQGGLGSGYDVATALLGGVCVFDPAGGGAAEAVAWPEGLHGAVLFTGHGSSTTDRLRRLEVARRARPAEVRRALEDLGRAATAFVAAWRLGRPAPVLDRARRAQEALVALDAVGGLGVDEGGHGALREAIASAGAVARTSGAGGGDCAWALADDPERVAAAVRAAEAAGFRRLDVVDAGAPGEGLRVRRGEAS